MRTSTCLGLITLLGLCLTGCKEEVQSDADKLNQAFGNPTPAETVEGQPAKERPGNQPGENGVMQRAADHSQAAPPDVTVVQKATKAIHTKDYEAAATNLHALSRSTTLTPEQRAAVESTMTDLQQQIVDGLQRGDPKAKRAAEALKKMIGQ